jgi:hypothetical protein
MVEMKCKWYSNKAEKQNDNYLDPDFVLTTVLLDASSTITDVVIGSPFLNEFDPLTKPLTVLSLFNVHFDIVGTPLGAVETAGGCDLVETVVDVVSGTGATPPPNPNSEKVGRGSGDRVDSSWALGGVTAFAET